MKLLLENWREYLNEAEDPKHLDELESFLKNIAILAQAAEDADEARATEAADEELEEGAGRKNRMARRSRRAHTREIKKQAELSGIKFADFTPEQKNLYKKTREDMELASEAKMMMPLNTIANGNILKVPMIRRLVARGGAPLKAALTLAVGECGNNMTLTCLVNYFTAQAQTGV